MYNPLDQAIALEFPVLSRNLVGSFSFQAQAQKLNSNMNVVSLRDFTELTAIVLVRDLTKAEVARLSIVARKAA